MSTRSRHWTEKSIKDFAYRIAFDFVSQLEKRMDARSTSQKELAKILGVSPGRVSQVLNNPGNLTLQGVVQYARALGMKASIVAYDDLDSENRRGPITAEIFEECWNVLGRPVDFFALRENSSEASILAALRGGWGREQAATDAQSSQFARSGGLEGTAATIQ